MCRAALVALALLCTTATAHAADPKTDRLVALGKVWGKAKFFHPYMTTRTVDWDAPLIAAIPKARAAATDDDFAKVVDEMLATLKDPVSRVTRPAPPPTMAAASASAASPVTITRLDKGVLVIDLPAIEDLGGPEVEAALDAVPLAFDGVKAIVIDLRFAKAEPMWLGWRLESWAPLLLPPGSVGPSMRAIVHDGYAPQGKMMSSGGYSTYAKTTIGATYRTDPAAKRPSPDVRVVLLVNDRVALDAGPWTLQQSGHGFVVAQGQARYTHGDWAVVELPGGHVASVRTTEWSEAGFGADVTVAAKQDGLKKALALARKTGPIKPRTARAAALALPRFVADEPYAAMTEPAVEYRLLALYKVWTVIDEFYPYLPLIGDWDAVLPEFVPRFESATTADAYARALLELGTRVPDGHTGVWGLDAITKVWGQALLDLDLRWIEQQAVVTRIHAPAAISAGLAVGDVILAIDGEAMATRIARLLTYTSASTEATRYRNVLRYALSGPPGNAVLSVRDAKGKTKELTIARAETRTPRPPPTTPPYRLIGTDLGYVVLAELTVAQVAPMFEALKTTKAIIFDMRGYPQGTAWSIAPRLNTRRARNGALFHRRYVDPSTGGTNLQTIEFYQPLPTTTEWIYQGKTVMLIDDRTQSQAEHTGLFFNAANGTRFVGTPTAGANGDVTTMQLPGGVTWMFTGHDVRHADGRQLQRVGLQPDVRVEPTLKGIRAGQDEVLDRAIALLRTGK